MGKLCKCQISMGKTISTQEDMYYSISIINKKENIDLEIKMNAEEFANFITGSMASISVNIRNKTE